MPRATLRQESSSSPYRFGDGGSATVMVAGGWTRRIAKGSRPRTEPATRMSGRDSAALALFAIYALTVALWLFGGLAPVLSATSPTVLATFSEWAEGGGALASLSRRVVQASTEAPHGATVLIDYFISVVGLGLALLIMWIRPHDLAARLLAVGMVGIAAVFNQPSHIVFEILPAWIKQPGPHFIVHATAGPAFAHACWCFLTAGCVLDGLFGHSQPSTS